MADINFGNATPGLGRLALALGGSGGVGSYQRGYDNELNLQSKLAQALAAIDAHNAEARLNGLKADAEQTQLDARKPEAVLSSALTSNGIPTDEAPAVTNYFRTGSLGGKYGLPSDQAGPVAPTPTWAGNLGAVARTVAAMNQATALGDKSVENVAKAEEARRTGALAQGVVDGTVDPLRFNQSQYALKGEAPFAFHEFGTGNNLTGQLNDQTGPAVRFAQYRGAQTADANAGAAAHYAAADASRASAEHSRAETSQINNAPKGQLVQTDNGPVFADPRTGKSVPVQNPDGTPAAPKLQNIPPAQNHAFVENAKAIDNIDAATAAIYKATGIKLDANGNPVRDPAAKPSDPNALGALNYLGEAVRQRTDPNGVSVRAQVANIGGQKYHDVSGANVTASESPRLAPFIPTPTDSAVAALQKLANLRREYQNVNDMLSQTYSRDQGYKPSFAARQGGGGGGVVDLHAMPSGGAGGREINFSDLKN